jgi:hypothetical protein
MSGGMVIYYAPPTLMGGELCVANGGISEKILSTTPGVTLFDSAGATYPVSAGEPIPGTVPTQYRSSVHTLFQVTKGGVPFAQPDTAQTVYTYERIKAGSVVITGALSTDGTSGGMGLLYSFLVEGNGGQGASLLDGQSGGTALLEMNNENLTPVAGAFYNILAVADVELVEVTKTLDCNPPPGPPGPSPTPPPAPPPDQTKINANDKNPGLSVDWGRDNRWPDVVTVNTLGLGIAYAHPHLTGTAGPRLALLTSIQQHFSVVDNPPSFKVESDYTLDRIPDTNAAGDNLFLTFDDPEAGPGAGLLV